MTREEAIEFGNMWLQINDDSKNSHTYAFFQTAIKALEQEPTTKNDLGVDWDELKRKILMEVDGGTDAKWLSYSDVCDNISNSIDDFKAELPSVTPIRPKGHWIEEKNDYGEIEHWHCSNCYDDSGFITTCKWDYCPNCGSDNREVEE